MIAYGKVLEDDNKTLKDYGIKEGDFLVVMVSKVGINQPLNIFSPSLKLLLSLNLRMLRRKILPLHLSLLNSHLLRLNLSLQLRLTPLLLKLSPLLLQVRPFPQS